MHLLTGDYLFNTPTDESGYFLALTIAFALLFIGSAIAYVRRAKLARDNPIRRRLIRRAAKAGMWTSAIGLFLALMRYTQFPYLSMPIWMLLLIITMIIIVGYFVYELSERYPVAVWQLQESHLERRFRPAPKPRAEPQRPRPPVRGKRRR
ncbi:MAG TPA: hypothetical protein VKX16_03535 [Chloroflexota bacterium]|nr:hypothetical protein [Chloroflexota bacterium]